MAELLARAEILDSLDFGLVSCPELVPDLWELMDLLVDEFAALERAVLENST